MITISLLHPIQPSPVQNWTFDESESVIRIGRATDNHVILYSAVVSRHHVELKRTENGWSVVNLGANGTYLEGQRIDQVPVSDQLVIRLARSGPNLQISVVSTPVTAESSPSQPVPTRPIASIQQSATQNPRQEVELTYRLSNRQEEASEDWASEAQSISEPELAPAPETSQPDSALLESPPGLEIPPTAQPDVELVDKPLPVIPLIAQPDNEVSPDSCAHARRQPGMLFCIDCGHPLQIVATLGQYSLVKPLQSGNVTTTYLAWNRGQRYWLTTLNQTWLGQPEVVQQFEQQVQPLLTLQHPALPHYQGYFMTDDHPYLVMNEVPGQDLHRQVKNRGPFSVPDAIAVILQVCDVLADLHQQMPAIVHESIRPDYLIQFPPTVSSAPVTVTGFASLRSWQPGQPLATEGYTAPEVYQGESTPASDLYSLGPTLIYLVTGTDPRTFYIQGDQGFRLYPENVPGLSSDLVVILRRLTSPQPEDRYGTALEVVTALKQLNID